jgi:hypothetical protein
MSCMCILRMGCNEADVVRLACPPGTLMHKSKEYMNLFYLFKCWYQYFLYTNKCLDYLQVKIAAATRKQLMKL